MATKPAKASDTDVEELLDTLDKKLDRLKTLYEQYFLGIQKQAPSFIHNDVERKIRDLTQMNLRNTGVRYRLATLTQKFGSYNSYWRRTLRQIENGTYARQLQKVGRDAVRSGADVPEEILAAMPKRMRDQVMRDREAAVAIARRRQAADDEARLAATDEAGLPPEADADFIAMIKEPTELRRKLKGTDGSHLLDDAEGEFDIDAFFAEVEERGEAKPASRGTGVTTPSRTKSPTTNPRGRTTSTPPLDRPRSTTRNDLVRQGTAPPPAPRPPTSTPTSGSQPLARPETENDAVTRPAGTATHGFGGRPATGRAAPPPIPGRATGAQPAITRASTHADDDTPTGNHAPLDPNAGAPLRQPAPLSARAATAASSPSPTGRPTGAQPVIDPRTGLPFGQVPLDPVTGRPMRAATVPGAPSPPRASSSASSAGPAIMPPSTGVPNAMASGAPSGRVSAPLSSSMASSQSSRPVPIVPGTAAARGSVPVESLQGPFPRDKLATPAIGIPSIPKPGTFSPATTQPSPSVGAPARMRPKSLTPSIGMPSITKLSPFGSPGGVPKPFVPTSVETQPLPAVGRAPAGRAPASALTPPGGVPAPAKPDPEADVIVTKTPAAGSAAARPTPRTPAHGVPAIKPGTGARPPAGAPQRPPPGMTDADVNALYAKYVKAKEMVGEAIGPGEHSKLLKTINAQAPKIMEQYKAKGVDFSVVVKDNQVIIRAKPKT
ncbi:hypothetical protein BH11MYX1_BH11MYX1_23440 [soil metagenome]